MSGRKCPQVPVIALWRPARLDRKFGSGSLRRVAVENAVRVRMDQVAEPLAPTVLSPGPTAWLAEEGISA
jgi:hypothetical protein